MSLKKGDLVCDRHYPNAPTLGVVLEIDDVGDGHFTYKVYWLKHQEPTIKGVEERVRTAWLERAKRPSETSDLAEKTAVLEEQEE